MLLRCRSIFSTSADSATFCSAAISRRASQNSFSNETLVLRPFMNTDLLITAVFIACPCVRPDRRIQIILTLWWIVTVASDLHQSEDAIVARWKSALGIAITIAALESAERPLRHAASESREELPESAGAVHFPAPESQCAKITKSFCFLNSTCSANAFDLHQYRPTKHESAALEKCSGDKTRTMEIYVVLSPYRGGCANSGVLTGGSLERGQRMIPPAATGRPAITPLC